MKTGESHPNNDVINKPLDRQSTVVTDPGNNSKLGNNKVVQITDPSPNQSNTTNPTIVVVVLQRIQQLRQLTLGQIVWRVIVLCLMAVCLWHIIDRTLYYFREPTSFQITVDRLHHVQFPAITICPSRKPFQDEEWDKIFELSNLLDSPKANFSLDDIWSEYAVTEEDLTITALCDEKNVCNTTDGLKLNLKTTVLDTVLGRCVTLSQDVPVKYRGYLNYWFIILSPGHYAFEGEGLEKPSAAQFFLHDPGVEHRHEADLLVDEWKLEKGTGIELTLKQYEFQNLSRDPCYSQTDVIDCKNKCVDDNLDHIVNCSLPFMKSKRPSCRTVFEAKRAYDRARKFFDEYDWSECVCQRQCQENVYLPSTDTVDYNITLMAIGFRDNLVEKVYEEYSYSFSALLSDIGGSVGLFLGLSLLHGLQMVIELLPGLNKTEQ